MRGSNPNAAILYLAIMLDGGEDPVFIARRLMIFASEDIGNADPSALTLAVAGLQSVEKIGMPEARIILAQVTTYLASTVKSNAAYNAINEALDFVKESPTIEVPDHLKSFPPKSAAPYKYPHSYPGHFVEQSYAANNIPDFYRPTENGREKAIKERLQSLWKR
jgi:putative ATPase